LIGQVGSATGQYVAMTGCYQLAEGHHIVIAVASLQNINRTTFYLPRKYPHSGSPVT